MGTRTQSTNGADGCSGIDVRVLNFLELVKVDHARPHPLNRLHHGVDLPEGGDLARAWNKERRKDEPLRACALGRIEEGEAFVSRFVYICDEGMDHARTS